MIGRAICFLLFATLPSMSFATAPETVNEKDFIAYKELTQTKLDAAQTSTSKEIQILQTRLDSQDKRLNDHQSRFGDFGSYLQLYGILITLAVAALGLIGYFSVRNRAREEARLESQKWFDDHAKQLQSRIDELLQQVEQQADQHKNTIQISTSEVVHLAETAKQSIQENMSRITTDSGHPPIPPVDDQRAFQALNQIAEQSRNKPESEYSFDDWDNRAYAAVQANQLEEAVYFWQRATEIPGVIPLDLARALFNKGISLGKLGRSEDAIVAYNDLLERFGDATALPLRKLVAMALINNGIMLGELGRNEDAITVYNDLLTRFGNAKELPLREEVAKALVNKSVRLFKIERSEDAIAICNDLLARFGNANELALREQVAMALLNKGIALNKLGRGEDAIAVYDEVQIRFGNATEPTLRERVAHANNSKGFSSLCLAKSNWNDDPVRTANLTAAMDCFSSALVVADISPGLRGFILGNQAYATALSNKPGEMVRDLLKQALSLGCDELYQATLKDLEISPVPKDTDFRQLLDAVWAEVRPICEEQKTA